MKVVALSTPLTRIFDCGVNQEPVMVSDNEGSHARAEVGEVEAITGVSGRGMAVVVAMTPAPLDMERVFDRPPPWSGVPGRLLTFTFPTAEYVSNPVTMVLSCVELTNCVAFSCPFHMMRLFV